MDSSNEFNHDEINNSKDGRIQVNETFKYSLITDSGDVIDCSNNNDENRQSINQFDDNDRTCPIPENSIKINEYQYFNLHNFINEEKDNEQNIVLPENIDLQDLNPCEPSPSELSLYNKSQESILSPMYQLSLVDFESSSTSTSLILPQFAHKSSNSFQQLWSPRVYSPKLIDSNISKSTLSILWSYYYISYILVQRFFDTIQYYLVFVIY
jgi:hypothetical protein